ncbi:MAG TPA: 16S rRNA (guanine(527)-N(7))-methyltransferase RsmG [Pyrinomonadaceae bacterium]|nr:16S rRNA (guanine(527)-N(7))-methyltransferase RsmG [Pyrinomonadaceae bacterium]
MDSKQEYIRAIETSQSSFGLNLSAEAFPRLADYYELVEKWNPRLHLVAPCKPEEFAVRHVLESLALLEHLPENAHLTDVGTGAGLPSIPCLLAREDLRGTLIESNSKKVVFLREAAAKFKLQNRVSILNSRFESSAPPENGFVTSRALDKFIEKLPEIIRWARDAEKLLLFGGTSVREELEKLDLAFAETLLPGSAQRFLFAVPHSDKSFQTEF